jgi:UDP-N-acetylglucosamine transferase subunit ALG13
MQHTHQVEVAQDFGKVQVRISVSTTTETALEAPTKEQLAAMHNDFMAILARWGEHARGIR